MLETKARIYKEQTPHNDVTLIDAVRSFLRFCRRQDRVIISSLLIFFTLGSLYALLTANRYTARAVIYADLSRQEINPPQQQQTSPSPDDPTQVDSQVEVLRSLNVLLPVVEQLKLKDDPEFSKRRWLSDQNEQAQLSSLLEALDKSLQVKRVGKTHIIEVLFTARSPARAAEVTNAIANSFIQDRLQAKYEAAQRAIAWLHNRLTALKKQASSAEEDVERFKATHRLSAEAITQQLNEIRSRRATIQSEVANAETTLSRIDSILRSDFSIAAVNGGILEASSTLANLRSRYLELVNREAELTSAPNRNQAAEADIRNQIEQLRASIKEELKQIANVYQNNYKAAKEKEQAISEELTTKESSLQNERESQNKLRELENIAKNFRTTYDDNAAFLQRDIEQLQQQSIPTSGARIISLALPPLKPTSPKVSLLSGGSALAGLILGFTIGLFRDMSDRTFRSRGQIETILELPCITMVPDLNAVHSSTVTDKIVSFLPANFEAKVRRWLSLRGSTAAETDWIESLADGAALSSESDLSRFFRSVQAISASLEQDQVHKEGQIIGITSTLRNEGRSTISAYLAQKEAKNGKRVILLDCDFRVMKLTQAFAKQSPIGIHEILMGDASREKAFKYNSAGFAFLGAGSAPFSATNDIFVLEKTRHLFEELRKNFDYVILDLPPVETAAGVGSVGRFVDLYLFVIEWGGAQTQIVQQTLNATKIVRNNILGVILNKVDFRHLADYDQFYVDDGAYRAGRSSVASERADVHSERASLPPHSDIV